MLTHVSIRTSGVFVIVFISCTTFDVVARRRRTHRAKRTRELIRRCHARLVCAQHGHVVNGVQVPCGNTRNETKPPPEAKRGRATDRVKEGYGKAAS